ncbi:hypothetical protein GCM10008086_09720 [Salegentibacter mishustinae]|nr:glycosyltransferase [Salegentibacter mishustinae]PNW23534.1 hypothetical protein APB85_01915 [Salegentibacter mishustinae]GGW83489.1 hypothetical protein GCM10008086_09720 [Salegentibacter mishustinae]
MTFWGYKDDYSDIDSEKLPGKKNLFQNKKPIINKFFYSRQFRKELYNSVNRNNVIHLHSLWIYTSVLTFKLQHSKGSKKVISTHGMLDQWALNNGKLKKQIFFSLFEKKNLQSAHCIHALCEEEYLQIRRLIPKVPIAIIPNGVNLPSKSLKTISKTSKKTLLYLGRIHPKKGLENLIISWASKNDSSWNLVIAGPDEDNHQKLLMKLIRKLNLQSSVKIVGPHFGMQKQLLFKSADAFILPSFSEGLPMSILEAWSYQLPVLMTPECNLKEGFEINAAIYIETNTKSISNGLETLFAMGEDQLLNMGNNGFELVKEKYTWEAVGNKMIGLYDWVCGKIEKPSFVYLK